MAHWLYGTLTYHFFEGNILTAIWVTDLFLLIHDLAILVSWRGRSFDLSDDWLRGEVAS